MRIVIIGAAASSTSSPAIILWATVRVRQWTGFAEVMCAAAGRRLRRAVSYRREALKHRLDKFFLELLAVIVLIAIFMIMAEEQS